MDLAANGTRIAAAINSGSQFAVRVLDTNTGLLQWEQTSTAAPGSHEHLLAAGINTDTVFVAGDAGQDFGNSQFLVQAYDVLTGHLLWDDRSHSSARTTAVDLAVGRFRLFVAGYTTNSTTNADFLIRAYDIRPSTNATH
jgi:outer membrane protein assembly factor BamB